MQAYRNSNTLSSLDRNTITANGKRLTTEEKNQNAQFAIDVLLFFSFSRSLYLLS